ncbi:uncharacterized protein LAESUDRAFT_709093 [Laetiporus sulphureus 93-53]|uniref:Fe2OG dioxygenase domain-containing protein n=1 Tax=Laetiporus sulphureus 93-53 TaxID=1314785 RepID=A0A165B5B4_9APHY|nr:uncharacterized protein LAESUDRAFT_709093 [Laetiporus sulphureus 93-53]KZT00271.1 hypothetical protein LAESUDRAFT_709093 [Laetiporus sulphureus 93-53]
MIPLSQYLVPHTQEVYYIPDFVSVDEEDVLIRKIQASPLPKWRHLANRRLQIWGGNMTAKKVLLPEAMPDFVTMFPDIVGRIAATGAFSESSHRRPNHIIVNEYLPGQGIMPHEDGPAYHPVVTTLSLGSHAVFHYYRYKPSATAASEEEAEGESGKVIDPEPVLSVLLEPRSLVITTSSLYQTHLHGIEYVAEDAFHRTDGHTCIANVDLIADGAAKSTILRGGKLTRRTRYSLTCRDVEKVAGGLPFGKRWY